MEFPCDDSVRLPVSVPELTAAIAGGDEAAFTRFHELYWKRVFAYLMVVTQGDEAVAIDVAQTTMIRAATRLRAMSSEEALWAWLRRVARNALIDLSRARSSRLKFVEWPEEASMATAVPHPTDGRLVAALEEALAALTPEERSLIEETYLGSRRQDELATDLGLSLKALESRLGRLRRKLRNAILSYQAND